MGLRRGKIRSICLVVVLSLIQFSSSSAICNSQIVTNGIYDLRNIDKNSDFCLTMNGSWEFYPGSFLDPTGKNIDTITHTYAFVPSIWSSLKGLPKPEGTGYGTYRCRVLLPPDYHNTLGFNIPPFETSYEMSINGSPVSSNGKPGKNKNENIPDYKPRFIKYTPSSDTLEILIKTANFEVRNGGFWLPMKIGTYHVIQKSFSETWIFSTINSTILFTIFLFSVFIFLQNPKNKRPLVFSLLVLPLALRPLFSSPYLITLFDDITWSFIFRAKYINLFILLTCGTWFVHLRYPSRFSAIGLRVVTIVFAILIPSVFILNTKIISYSDLVINSLALLIVGYAFIMSLLKTKKWKPLDVLYSLSVLLIVFGVCSDIRLSAGIEDFTNIFISSFTFMIYALIQSSMMIKEWMSNSKEKEKLYNKSEDLMKTLEKRIEERTGELSKKNTEIEKQNYFIVEQNKKLTETIKVKNRIFSVIAHDLRSPIVNILYGLNLIKEDKSGDEKEFLANMCIKNSKMAINLLENMLIWGSEQNDHINYSPDIYDIADIILTNMSIFKENADKKNIKLNFTQIGTSKGWFDKDLVDIIIRNLISNSIKFTGHNGRVNITVKGNEKSDEGLVLKIADNGIGMSMEKLDAFFSGKTISSTFGTDSEKGTGIGLKLVYDLVKISHGTITAESTPSIGTVFIIFLPGKSKAILQNLTYN
jgi:signal transduction histidine kinase